MYCQSIQYTHKHVSNTFALIIDLHQPRRDTKHSINPHHTSLFHFRVATRIFQIPKRTHLDFGLHLTHHRIETCWLVGKLCLCHRIIGISHC